MQYGYSLENFTIYDKRDTCKHPICQPSITMYMGCLQVSLFIPLAQVVQNLSAFGQSDTCIHLFWPANRHNLPESRAGL